MDQETALEIHRRETQYQLVQILKFMRTKNGWGPKVAKSQSCQTRPVAFRQRLYENGLIYDKTLFSIMNVWKSHLKVFLPITVIGPNQFNLVHNISPLTLLPIPSPTASLLRSLASPTIATNRNIIHGILGLHSWID